MERRTFLKGLIGAAAVACLPLEWIEGDNFIGNIKVIHPEYFRVKDIIHVPRTKENMIITAIKDNFLTVTRGLGTNEPKPLVNEDPVWILGSVEPVDPDEGIPAPLSFPSEGLMGSDWESAYDLPAVDFIVTEP